MGGAYPGLGPVTLHRGADAGPRPGGGRIPGDEPTAAGCRPLPWSARSPAWQYTGPLWWRDATPRWRRRSALTTLRTRPRSVATASSATATGASTGPWRQCCRDSVGSASRASCCAPRRRQPRPWRAWVGTGYRGVGPAADGRDRGGPAGGRSVALMSVTWARPSILAALRSSPAAMSVTMFGPLDAEVAIAELHRGLCTAQSCLSVCWCLCGLCISVAPWLRPPARP